MNFSLVHVDFVRPDGLIDGTWIQHAVGTTLDEAVRRARRTEEVNSFSFRVAVVEQLSNSSPDYSLRMGLNPLHL